MDASFRRTLLLVAVVAAAYCLGGRAGLALAYLDGAVAAAWPPAGVGLAAVVLSGPRVLPGVVIGDLLLGDFSTPLGTVLAQTVGNTLALVLAALLLRRLTGGSRTRRARRRRSRHRRPLGPDRTRARESACRRPSGCPW